jgi:hypothetical protein
MGYFEDRRKELEVLLSDVERRTSELEQYANAEREALNSAEEQLHSRRNEIDQLARERQVGFPSLARAYDELFEIADNGVEDYLRFKKHSAWKAADIVKEQSRLRREAEQRAKVAEFQVAFYEEVAPFLVDLKEEVSLPTAEDQARLAEYSQEELDDEATLFLTKAEYRALSQAERNQLALDRYWKRPKSRWEIGRLYERYVGYLFEKEGFDVEYVGIVHGYEDLGRDLICRRPDEIVVVQCKNWSQFRTIYEKHIFQFFGTVFQFRDSNPSSTVRAAFYTSTEVSPLARRFAQELGIDLDEAVQLDRDYPCIKCNVARPDGTKIYHLPFDQQYDKTRIEPARGEFYCATVAEAEAAGFRRAFRYRGRGPAD